MFYNMEVKGSKHGLFTIESGFPNGAIVCKGTELDLKRIYVGYTYNKALKLFREYAEEEYNKRRSE